MAKNAKKKALDPRRKLNDAQVITTALVAAYYFQGNQHHACAYMRDFFGFDIPDKSNFNKILHQLSGLIEQLFYQLADIFKNLNLSSRYIIDSCPIAVCKNIRIPRAKILKGEQYRGYNASKQEYVYGLKIHLICTEQGLPVEYFFSPASYHDNKGMQQMEIDLPENSILYADAAYLNKEIKHRLQSDKGIDLKPATRKNSIEKNSEQVAQQINKYRKRIETSFSCINAFLPKRIQAVTQKGLLLKILLTIIAFILHRKFK